MNYKNRLKPKIFKADIKSFFLSDYATHVFIWLFFYLISLDFFLQYLPLIGLHFSTEKVITYCTIYIALFIPIPYFILSLRKKISDLGLYVLIAFLIILLISPLFTLIDYLFIYNNKPNWFFNIPHLLSRVPYLIILTFILHWVNFRSKYKEEQRRKEREEKLKKQAELNMLISQISPHFFFNLLNNLNSLIYSNQDLASEQVVRISDLLRYVIYEGRKDKVCISQEVEYLENYIYLCKKQKDFGKVSFKHEITKKTEIQPLLFINFVENAFKHCRLEDNDYIRVSLKSSDSSIEFECINTFYPDQYTNNEVSGLGLNNIRERLEISYPEKYILKTDSTNNVYKVNLIIKP
ncbi:MAG: histidine kinase [Psychroflexus sp.]|nr:histidine kinase [Psychroflexus sp.]